MCGYTVYQLEYKPPQSESTEDTNKKRTRKRNISWFNPPYSENVRTNVGKKFLNLLDRCFPPGHQLHKLLNRNTVKVSYSCMPNMKSVISSQNKSINKKIEETPTEENCNCRKGKTCPLDGKCQTSGIIYQAIVTREDNRKEETYIGLTENTFKTRYNNHTHSFRNQSKETSTTLSQYIWHLKDNNIDYNMKWKLIAKGTPYSTSTKKCNLCLKEKYFIICKPHMASLNHRNELASECRHRKKYLLCNLKE